MAGRGKQAALQPQSRCGWFIHYQHLCHRLAQLASVIFMRKSHSNHVIADCTCAWHCTGFPRQSSMASEPSGMLLPPSGMSSPESIKEKDSIQSFRPSLKTHFFTYAWQSMWSLVCVLSKVEVSIITFVCVFLLHYHWTQHIFLLHCIVALLGRGRWVGAVCTLIVWMSFGSFSLWELTCVHCEYLALWTRKVLCGSFECAIYKLSFIHSQWSEKCHLNSQT